MEDTFYATGLSFCAPINKKSKSTRTHPKSVLDRSSRKAEVVPETSPPGSEAPIKMESAKTLKEAGRRNRGRHFLLAPVPKSCSISGRPGNALSPSPTLHLPPPPPVPSNLAVCPASRSRSLPRSSTFVQGQ